MATRRIDLQPSISLNAVTTQDLQFAGRIPGGAKSGMAVVTITTGASSGSLSFLTAPDLSADISGWASLGSLSTLSAGVKTVTLSGMADYVCWKLGSISGGPVVLSIVVYAYDA